MNSSYYSSEFDHGVGIKTEQGNFISINETVRQILDSF